MESNKICVTRRRLLSAGAALGAGAALTGAPANANPFKSPKDRVHFVEVAADPRKSCGACKIFRAPSECLYVDGPVNSGCSCSLFVAKVA